MRKLHIKDHVAEFMNRLQLNPVAGQTGVYDYTPVYGEVYQQGDEVLAQHLNTIQTYVDEDKQDKVEAVGLLKGEGSGTVSAAVAGTDYATPAQVAAKQDAITAAGLLKGDGSTVSAAVAGTDYATPAQVAVKQDAITASGILKGNGSTVSAAVAGTDYIAGNDYAHLATPLTTGTSTAFTLTLDPPLTAYTTGMMLAVRFHTSGNTGATLNINGLGAKTIYGLGSTLLLPISSGVHMLLYDGTYWRLMDSFLSAFGGTVRGSISPSSSSYSLGSSTSRWYNVHTTNLTVNGSSMDDFVTEQGTSGIWTYRKWKSGVAELWGASGSLTASGSGVTLSLPFAIKNFNGVASPGYNTSPNLKTVYTVGLSGNNQTGSSSIKLWAVDPSTGGTPTYSIYAQMYITGTLV